MAKLDKKVYERELELLQIELVKLQEWVKQEKLKLVVIFEGRDAAGKGGVIKTITEKLNPRVCRVAALPAPTEKEKTQWYFQRYVAHLPAGGEIVLFDRSWYNRAGVEKVMGFCSDEEYQEFLRSCLNLNACCNVLGSSYSNTGFQYPMKSKSGALSSGLIRPSNAGNSVQWISSLVSAGQPIRELKMRCLLTPIPNTARGGWCLG